MRIEDIIKVKIKERKITQALLAEKTGFANQANIGSLLNSKSSMRVENALKLLDALDCELIIRDKLNGNEWVVSNEEKE